MDEVIINQTKYISSKRASKASGYAKDYIGQLVRMGKLRATKVGRAWFVDELALMGLITGKRDLPALQAVESRAQRIVTPATLKSVASVSYPKTWSSIKYLSDDSSLLPSSDSRDTFDLMDNFGSASALSSRIPAVSEVSSAQKVFIRKNVSKQGVSVRSIDGIRVSVSDFQYSEDDNSDSARHFVAPEVLRIGSPQSSGPTALQNVLRISVSAIIVSFVVLLIPIFG